MITLRPYQVDAENRIRLAFASGFKAPLYVLPCGGGKTITFASIAHSADRRGKRVLILCHRVELVDQIVAALNQFDVKPDVIAASYQKRPHRTRSGNRGEHPVTVASVQTLIKRLEDYMPPTLIICDEAHHCATGNTWASILRQYPNARVLGVTATPARLDGHGLGAHFDKMIIGPSVQELIAGGYLVRARIFAPPTVDTSGLHIRAGDFKTDEAEALMDAPSITGDALSHYLKHARDLPALVFCTSVKHAHNVAERFRNDGIPSIALDGNTDRELRRIAVADFREGRIKVLASCDLFSEGFDVPGAHVGILLRPTASMGLFLQQVGRLLRPYPGKASALILDHVGNTQRFGLPDEDREWRLTAEIIKKKKAEIPTHRVCPKCFAASPARAIECVNCGVMFEVKPRQEVEQKEGELIELTREEIERKKLRREQGRAQSLEQLRAFARSKGYAPQWADHVWQAREAKRRVQHES